MTRGKWVALAVGLAVIAVLVAYGPALWRAVVFEESRVYGTSGLEPWKITPESEYIVIVWKRFSWLPGPQREVRCRDCAESRHVDCPRVMHGFGLYNENIGPSLVAAAARDLSCTCVHPSHAQESE